MEVPPPNGDDLGPSLRVVFATEELSTLLLHNPTITIGYDPEASSDSLICVVYTFKSSYLLGEDSIYALLSWTYQVPSPENGDGRETRQWNCSPIDYHGL